MSFDIAIRRRLAPVDKPEDNTVDIRVEIRSEAKILALVGPSGVGKSSVLNMIAGLLRPDAGRIAVGGRMLFDAAAGIDLPPDQRRAGYVFQDNRLFPHMRVRANLLYGERLASPRNRWIGADEVIDFLDIGRLVDRWPATLSGGETRRVAIGRALLSAPRFLLLDEPLVSLDTRRSDEILRTIERIRDELAIPILHVSHNPAEVARLTGTVVTLP